MQSATMNTSHEISVKCIPFDGSQEKFRAWKNKVLAHAAVKGFDLALETNLGPFITQAQYLASRLDALETTAVTGGAADAPGATEVADANADGTEVPATKSQVLKYKMNLDAFGFLMLSCEKAAYGFVEVHKNRKFPMGNAHGAWMALLKRYESSNIGSDFVELNSKFAECKLNGLSTDPDEWFQNMDYFNNRLSLLGTGSYAKDEFAMKVHIMGSLPKEYESIKTKYDGIVDSASMVDIQRDIVNFWKRNGGNKTIVKDSGNVALAETSSKFRASARNVANRGIEQRIVGPNQLTQRLKVCQQLPTMKRKISLTSNVTSVENWGTIPTSAHHLTVVVITTAVVLVVATLLPQQHNCPTCLFAVLR